MRKIKFRGKDFKGDYIYCSPFNTYFPFEYEDFCTDVDPDTIAQLVGYDKHGREVYEGDELTNADGKIYIAHWETAYRSADLIIRNRNLTDGCALVLKEKKS